MTNTQLYYNSVKEFHQAFAVKSFAAPSKVPTPVSDSRIALLEEEEAEYDHGRVTNNQLEILDGLCDLAYITAGTMHVYGVTAQPYSSQRPESPTSLSLPINAVIDEIGLMMPCIIRLTGYLNSLLQDIDDIGLKYNLPQAFKVVHTNNMTKLWDRIPEDKDNYIISPAPNGKYLVKNKQMKIVKPPGFAKPDLTPFIP
jgi:predicted HAD superfamily Cof-like phosphohydrolase